MRPGGFCKAESLKLLAAGSQLDTMVQQPPWAGEQASAAPGGCLCSLPIPGHLCPSVPYCFFLGSLMQMLRESRSTLKLCS